MLVSYNFLDGLLGYTPGSGSSNSTLGGLNNTLDSDDISLDSNSTLIGDEQPDTVSSVETFALYTEIYFVIIRAPESLTWPP